MARGRSSRIWWMAVAVPLVAIGAGWIGLTREAEPIPADSSALMAVEHTGVAETLEPAPAAAPVPEPEIRWFNGRPIRPVNVVRMKVTAYSPDHRSCGASADGITASGYSVWTNGMKMVAADTRLLPFGSLVSIPGYHDGDVVPVLDRGGRIKGHKLDVLYPTHREALRWGVKDLEVVIWAYADGKPNGFRTNH